MRRFSQAVGSISPRRSMALWYLTPLPLLPLACHNRTLIIDPLCTSWRPQTLAPNSEPKWARGSCSSQRIPMTIPYPRWWANASYGTSRKYVRPQRNMPHTLLTARPSANLDEFCAGEDRFYYQRWYAAGRFGIVEEPIRGITSFPLPLEGGCSS